MPSIKFTALVMALAAQSAPFAWAQPRTDQPLQAPAAAVSVSSPAVQRHVDAALRLAGPRYAAAAAHQCRGRPNIPQENRIAIVEPAKVFDNLYYVGMGWVGAWAIDTSDGIVLIDTLPTVKEADEYIVGGLRKLGVDPARIKYVVLTHNHGDHVGGSSLFVERYGARVMTSAPEWDILASGPTGPSFEAAGPLPKRDITISDGEVLKLGDTSIRFALTPGHTPGSVSMIFPVRENGKSHMAALVGGVTAQPNIASQQLALDRLKPFAKITADAGVEVELVDHPHVDDSLQRLQSASKRKPGDPNPFLAGRQGFQNYLGMLMECYQGNIARLEQR